MTKASLGNVVRVSYDFETRCSDDLYMSEGCCCDMGACVRLFKDIDAEVDMGRIEPDTCYRLFGDEWRVVREAC
jgi:hypothetical protein